MSLRQIRYFVAVAQAGSFTAAARGLRVSQPAITLQVRQLEERLGIGLLIRHSRGVELTEEGRAYLDHVALAMDALDRAEQVVAAMRTALPDAISFGLTPTAARELMPDLIDLEGLDSSRPRLELREALTDELWRAVSNGELDAACCYALCEGKSFPADPLYAEDFVLVGPPTLVAGIGPISLTKLALLPLVLGQSGHSTRRFVEGLAAAAGVELRPAVEIEPAAVKRAMLIRRGLCSLVPYGLFRAEIEAGSLAARQIQPPFSRTVGLILRAGASASLRHYLLGILRPLIARRIAEGCLRWHEV